MATSCGRIPRIRKFCLEIDADRSTDVTRLKGRLRFAAGSSIQHEHLAEHPSDRPRIDEGG
jgi:hypothetical protein